MQVNPWKLKPPREDFVPRWEMCVLLLGHLALGFSCASERHVQLGIVCQRRPARRSGVRDGITDGSG